MKIILLVFSMMVAGCNAEEHKVSMKNVEKFKSNFILGLPEGASRSQIESYLDIKGVSYTYIDEEKKFYASIPKIGRYRIIYSTSLFIQVSLDDNEKLDSIEFDLQHDGL